MKLLNLIAPAIFAVTSAFAQVAWLQEVDKTIDWQGIVCDEEGDAYLYGYNGGSKASSPAKSIWIARYRMDGVLKFLSAVPAPVTITKMVHDGFDKFYFAGNFYGPFTLNGKSYSAIAGNAAVAGCIGEDGKLVWMAAVEASGGTELNGIAWNSLTQRIAVTGNAKGDFSIEGQHLENLTERSLLLAEFDPAGHYIRHRAHDFGSGLMGTNSGNEIETDNKGGYFLLGRREGAPWPEMNPAMPYEGHYVFLFDQSLNIVWQQMVINGTCNYGSESRTLRSNGNNVFVSTYCHAKYGGEGTLMLLDGIDGSTLWSRTSTDAWFRDVCTASNGGAIFLVADDANGCPCPDNHPGYEVLRETDSQKNENLLIKCSGRGFLRRLARNNQGMVYVFGYTHDTINVAQFTVVRKAFLLALGNPPQYPTVSAGDGASESGIMLFPNPSPGVFTLRGSGVISDISVTAINGSSVAAELKLLAPGNWQIDCSKQAAGTYFLSIRTGDAVINRKVVIQR